MHRMGVCMSPLEQWLEGDDDDDDDDEICDTQRDNTSDLLIG